MNARHPSGFTLIELLFTITVTATLVMIAVPSFKDLSDRRQLSSAAQLFAMTLRQAQGEAVSRNRNIEVLFTTSDPVPAATSSAVKTTAAAGGRWIARERGSIDDTGFVTGEALPTRYPDVSMTATPTAVGFTPLGRVIDYSNEPSLPLAADLVVKFTGSHSTHAYCAYLTTGGIVGTCNPAAATGDARACVPRLAAGAC